MIRRPRDDGGQTTAEFALALPLVTLLVLLLVQAAAVARDRIAVVNAARDGARTAIVEPTLASVTAAVERSTSLDPQQLGVELRGGTDPGDVVTVVVRYRCVTSIPLIGALVPDIDLTEEFAAVVE